MSKSINILDQDYLKWIKELSTRYRRSQIKAAVKVNEEMPSTIRYTKRFYLLYCQHIENLQQVAENLEGENLQQVAEKSDNLITQQVVEKIRVDIVSVPWGHHMLLIDKVKGNADKALFFVHQTVLNGWSRNMLLNFLGTDLYERQGATLGTAGRIPARGFWQQKECHCESGKYV